METDSEAVVVASQYRECILSAQRGQGREASVGWSGLEAFSKNHFILQCCSLLSGNDTIFFSQWVFLPNILHRIHLQSQSIETNLHSPIPH